jgi:hypothetical protein
MAYGKMTPERRSLSSTGSERGELCTALSTLSGWTQTRTKDFSLDSFVTCWVTNGRFDVKRTHEHGCRRFARATMRSGLPC